MKKLFFAISLLIISNILLGQQMAESSQYFQSIALFNPSFAGTQDKINATLNGRKQWMNFKDAPFSQNISFQTRLNQSLGLSATANNESWGISKNTGANLGLNYIFKANKDYNLSFGLNTSLNQFGIDRSKIITEIADDRAIYDGIRNQLFLNFGASVFGSSSQYFWGISADNLLESKNNIRGGLVSNSYLNRTIYLTGGTHFILNKKTTLSPTFLFSKTKNAPSQIQADLLWDYNSKLWLSGGYRLNDAIVFTVGCSLGSIRIGYSYDITTSNLRSNLGNTHELFLGFNRTKRNFDWYSKNTTDRRL